MIRVFSVPNGDKIHEFRRGSYPAKIYSIAFNAVSSLLCVASDTETVHIFKLGKGNDKGGKLRSMRGNEFDDDAPAGRYREDSDGNVGGYEAFIDNKKSDGSKVGWVFFPFCTDCYRIRLLIVMKCGAETL